MANFSRSAESCVFGKCTSEVNKFSVPERVKADLARVVADSPFNTEAEYMRAFLLVHLYGEETIINLQAERIKAMGTIGGKKGVIGLLEARQG